MSPSLVADVPRWRRVNALLQEALLLSEDEREAWLRALGPRHADLLPALRALLARGAAAHTDQFMRRSADKVWAEAVSGGSPAAPGQLVGPYRLIREIGAGGMGTVWLAERADGTLQRQVALKLPRYGWAAGVAERLGQERDALAALEHPHIARLYDAGITPAGRPYLAMEYVDGLPIDAFAAAHGLSVRARVGLLQQVAAAVQYAHGRLVVHRDLKPSNILVTRHGEARLLDFGAAKLLHDGPQDSALTREVGRALSPDYAAPEQIRNEPITVASDVYSLGIVLFELLTGSRPYTLGAHHGLAAALAAADVALPSSRVGNNRRLSRELRGDLDNIITKALKRDPRERYRTVLEFSEDLQRWLNHEPVLARGDSLAYRAAKFVRRNRTAVAAAVLTFLALAGASVVTSAEMFEARRQRDDARQQAKRAEAEERFTNMVMEQSGPGGRPLTREEMIDRSVELLEQQYANDPGFIARALIPISGRYMDLGNTEKELAALQKAEDIARRLSDPVLLLDVQCNTVETELARGRADLAAARMNEAVALLATARALPLSRRIDCIHAEATLADVRGERAKALERINAALALQEQLDRTDRTYRSLLSHAQVLYLHAGRPREANAIIEKTVAVLKATDAKNNEELAGSLHNQAVALQLMGELSAALGREREALALTTGDAASAPLNPVTAIALGRLLTRLNNTDEAATWARHALQRTREGGNLTTRIFALVTLAETRAAPATLPEAEAAVAEATALLTPTSEPRLRIAVDHAAALLALRSADLPRAQAAVTILLRDVGYPHLSRMREVAACDTQLLLAARVALAAGRPDEAAALSVAALNLATAVARDPLRSATVGEARLLLARARAAQHDPVGAREAIQGAALALQTGLTPRHPLTLEARELEAHL